MLQVRLLGQFDVRVGGRRVTIPSRAGQSLFAFLILTAGTAHRRERLAGQFWPDTSDDAARRNLRQELWRIRKALTAPQPPAADYLLAEELTLNFNPDAEYWLDVAQLERPLSPTDDLNQQLSQVVLYQGELLPGLYDDWVVLERERVQALFESHMRQLLERLIQEQRWTTVVEWSERWIALGSAPEPAYRALMLAYAALGDKSKVVSTYERCVEALDKELSVEPSEETRTLQDQLMRGEAVIGVDLAATHVSQARALALDDPPTPGDPPFKGLQFFDEGDAALFFGRERLTAKLIGHLRESRFLAVVVGASGSGKSSVVRAGVIPALRRGEPLADGALPPDGSTQWQMHVLTPTARPLEALAVSLTRGSESVTATATLMDDLAREARSLYLFVRRAFALGENRSHLLLVVDQFEELFTLCRDAFEREAFIDNLLAAVAPESGGLITLVITIRADFYAHLAQYPELRHAVAERQEYIGPMTVEELRRAIEEPAKRGGADGVRWELQPGLVDVMLRDVGDEPGGLPLLSHALLETWKRRSGRTLTLKGYADSGGVRGAIAHTAETVYQELTPQQQAIARNIFLRLTELGEGTEDTRRRAPLRELVTHPADEAEVRAVLTKLADARLVTTSEDGAEVAHEALIREWPTLREWLTQDREGLLLHRHLTEAAREWELLERDPGVLYRGARLAQVTEWAAAHVGELNVLEREFLDASQALAEREAAEREAQRQRELEAARRLAETQTRAAKQLRRRAFYLTGAFILALAMSGVALVFGEQARQGALTAQNERRIAFARELAAAALNSLTIDPERSILLALQAVSTTRAVDGTVLPEAEEALHRSIVSSPIRMTLNGHETRVLSAAFSPDGKHLATIGDDGTTIVWDATTGTELLRLPGTTKPSDLVSAHRIAYSPDGKLLAACDSNLVKIHDASSGELTAAFTGHQTQALAVAFSPDGKRVASGSLNGEVRVWDVASGTSLQVLTGHTDWIEGIAFSPDGKWLVTGSNDATMKIWDVLTGDLVQDSVFAGLVDSVAFSPDGTQLAFTDGSINVWRLDLSSVEGRTAIAYQEIFNIPGAASVRFSPDGKQLAAASGSTASGNAAKLWDATTGQELLTLVGHTDWVMGLAFSLDGQRLASTSLDGTVRIWSLTPGQETVAVSGPGAGYGTRIAYSRDGQEFATNGGDGTATLWNAETGEPRLTLTGHDLEVLNVAFSSDGQRLATSSLDATAIVWDTATGQKLLALTGHEVGVRDIAFSPDGSRIATGGFDNTARIWDAATGKELLRITGHDGLVLGVAFSPDGTRLATSSTDTTAKIWDVKTGQLLFTLTGHAEPIPDIAFSPDGMKLATGSGDTTAKIWDASTGTELLTLAGHAANVQPVAFSPDGKFLATGSGDNTAKVWAVATGEEILTLPGSEGGVYGVAFSPLDGGAQLAVASNDGTVRVYLLRIEDVLGLAHSRVTRSLTTEECQKYLHVEVCLEE